MKTITVPKNFTALAKLDFDACPSEDLIQIEISSETADQLFAIGFFSSINRIANSMIDNYEDEQITDQKLLSALLKSGILDANEYPENIQFAVYQIKNLFIEAINRKTGIFFYF